LKDTPLGALFGSLAFLILLSAFFSAAEIALLTVNRYRMRHLADSGKRGAQLAQKLLERPDRLLGIILVGNNFANIAASSIATLIAIQLYGEKAIALAAGLLTFVVLIFAEVAPKTLAALNPERLAFPAAFILRPLLVLLYPLVWLTNLLANGLLRVVGVSVSKKSTHEITAEELRALVHEADVLIPKSHQDMLLAILDLERITVDDLMVPRGEIEGIDLDAEWDEILSKLGTSRYTRLPVYRGNLDNVVGLVHLRKVMHLMHAGDFTRENLMKLMMEPFYIPQGTHVSTALLNFRAAKRRVALIVNEYGDIHGLATLEDILEEIVGDFTTPAALVSEGIQPQPDGSFLVTGSMHIRELNRRLDWTLPTSGPKTLNGLITEYLEDLPEPGTSVMLSGYQVDIIRTRGTAVQLLRIRPAPPPVEERPAPP
jgi:Mg2+/Co2+ transporter CorB